MEDKFDEIVKWYEETYGIKREQLSLKEIVRIRKMADMLNNGVDVMEELKFNDLIEKGYDDV